MELSVYHKFSRLPICAHTLCTLRCTLFIQSVCVCVMLAALCVRVTRTQILRPKRSADVRRPQSPPTPRRSSVQRAWSEYMCPRTLAASKLPHSIDANRRRLPRRRSKIREHVRHHDFALSHCAYVLCVADRETYLRMRQCCRRERCWTITHHNQRLRTQPGCIFHAWRITFVSHDERLWQTKNERPHRTTTTTATTSTNQAGQFRLLFYACDTFRTDGRINNTLIYKASSCWPPTTNTHHAPTVSSVLRGRPWTRYFAYVRHCLSANR